MLQADDAAAQFQQRRTPREGQRTIGVVGMAAAAGPGQADAQPKSFVQVVISKDETIQVRLGTASKGGQGIKLPQLAGEVRKLQGTAAEAGTPADAVPVVISADKDIKYDTVVKAMDTLKRAGVERVGLAVQASR